jgi:LysM repeat protein
MIRTDAPFPCSRTWREHAHERGLAPRLVGALLLALSAALFATPTAAQDSLFVHVVRPGETLASIAQTYYGNPKRENVLVAENGLTDQGGSAIVEGMRLMLPTVHYYRVRATDTWRGLAERYYGDATRAPILIKANDAKPGNAPDEGAQLLIPYPVRHVLKQGETLISVAEQYYSSRDDQRLFRAFNVGKGKLTRGHIVLVPLFDLLLSEEGKARLESATGEHVDMGESRTAQAEIDHKLPALREAIQDGRFVEAVALGNQLLGSKQLTGYQEISIQRELATAYMALSREDLAIQAFAHALEKQPDLELDSVRTSPRVLKALETAKKAHKIPPPLVRDE